MRCAVCGYNTEVQDFRLECVKLHRTLPGFLRHKLKKLLADIRVILPASDEEVYGLLIAIQHFDVTAAEKAMDDYLYYGYHRQGKGIRYLLGMIRKSDESIEAQKKYEGTLQAIPPEVKND